MKALTRAVSDSIARCELTHLARNTIRLDVARRQHDEYERTLEALGCEVIQLPEMSDQPDAVFVEDTVVVLPEVAVLTRPGARSRRGEVDSVGAAIAPLRPVARIQSPGTLDGGDVLQVARQLFVGNSGRSNASGIEQLRELLAPHGYAVTAVPLHGCLHLKSAVTCVGPSRLLINPRWCDARHFLHLDLIETDPAEPFAANSTVVKGVVVYPDHFPRTRRKLEQAGVDVRTVAATELAKAEGGVSCCCVLIEPDSPASGAAP